MKFLGADKVLCLSPHPDDVELSMYGTIQKYADTMFTIVCCSLGTKTDSYSTQDRHDEIKDFWAKAPKKPILHFIDDWIELRQEHEWVRLLESQFVEDNTIVCCPSDADSHYEHRLIASASYALTRYKPLGIVQYKTPSTLHAWVPNLYVSIDDYYHNKLCLLQTIHTQQNKIIFDPVTLEAMHKDVQTIKRGIPFTEFFKIITHYQ